MKERIEKLKAEYARKIQMCDESLSHISEANQKARTAGDSDLMAIYSTDRREWSARREAYVQAKVDIDTLLDGLE